MMADPALLCWGVVIIGGVLLYVLCLTLGRWLARIFFGDVPGGRK